MNIFDWILIVLIAICLFFAIRYIVKHKGHCCGGSCNSCSRNCSERKSKDDEEQDV